ncbi:recombinase family protein [Nonomuraea wenchangensis]
MALIGLVRVSTDKQKTQRQHDALDPVCLKVIEEKASGKLATADRPDLLTALSYIREGDLLTVQEVDRLGRNRRAHRTLLHPRPGPRPDRGPPPRHRPQDQERPGDRP